MADVDLGAIFWVLVTFTKAFRAAFAVPASQSAIAGLITTSRHQRWIEAYLAQASAG